MVFTPATILESSKQYWFIYCAVVKFKFKMGLIFFFKEQAASHKNIKSGIIEAGLGNDKNNQRECLKSEETSNLEVCLYRVCLLGRAGLWGRGVGFQQAEVRIWRGTALAKTVRNREDFGK